MKYDVIVVGGGIAGLTSAAFLTKRGHSVLLCEKQDHPGGLVSSFSKDGFLYDGGVRGIVDSGIVKPMLKQLGIDVEFVKSIVSIGIGEERVRVETLDSLRDYRDMLVRLYPESEKDIDGILADIRKVMDYMDVLYGIENPLFKDLRSDKEYVLHTLLPWMLRFLKKSRKIRKFRQPVEEHLRRRTGNQSLIDIISQHFFQKTPASFALSYFSLYLDYEYPLRGTYDLVAKMQDFIRASKGVLETGTEIKSIDLEKKVVTDQKHRRFEFDQLIWAADQNQLYQAIDMETLPDSTTREAVLEHKNLLQGKRGGDSIYSLFVAVDLDKAYFQERSGGHMFYTPSTKGQSVVFKELKRVSGSSSKQEILEWMGNYLEHTTYEIAIPSLRNKDLAPEGKTGLVVSVLMDYDFIRNIADLGFYEEFKDFAEEKVLDVLSGSIFGGLKEKVLHRFSSSPLTIERLSGNLDGGITGWAFTNAVIPAINEMSKVRKACVTPMPHVLQAGQWTFNPSGLPISILTGKLAADEAHKVLAKGRRK